MHRVFLDAAYHWAELGPRTALSGRSAAQKGGLTLGGRSSMIVLFFIVEDDAMAAWQGARFHAIEANASKRIILARLKKKRYALSGLSRTVAARHVPLVAESPMEEVSREISVFHAVFHGRWVKPSVADWSHCKSHPAGIQRSG